jgi:hypothetical protein
VIDCTLKGNKKGLLRILIVITFLMVGSFITLTMEYGSMGDYASTAAGLMTGLLVFTLTKVK